MGVGPADVRAECPSAGRGRVGVGKSLGLGDRPLEMLPLGPCPVNRTPRGQLCGFGLLTWVSGLA